MSFLVRPVFNAELLYNKYVIFGVFQYTALGVDGTQETIQEGRRNRETRDVHTKQWQECASSCSVACFNMLGKPQ